jgi:hypothetical protein
MSTGSATWSRGRPGLFFNRTTGRNARVVPTQDEVAGNDSADGGAGKDTCIYEIGDLITGLSLETGAGNEN